MPDWLAGAAAAVGVVGGLAGVASFLWQVATWRRSTHRVKVSRSQAWFGYPNGSLGTDLVAVTVANVGSAPVTVTGWGVEMRPTQANLNVLTPLPGSTPLPHRLEAGASMDVHVEAQHLRDAQSERGIPLSKMRAWARLGTGQRVYAKWGMPVSTEPA
jgi:hypothetical protein